MKTREEVSRFLEDLTCSTFSGTLFSLSVFLTEKIKNLRGRVTSLTKPDRPYIDFGRDVNWTQEDLEKELIEEAKVAIEREKQKWASSHASEPSFYILNFYCWILENGLESNSENFEPITPFAQEILDHYTNDFELVR